MIVRRVLLIGFVYCIVALAEYDVRVMTFNIWLSGAEVTHGLQKIHISTFLFLLTKFIFSPEVEDPLVVSNLTSMLGPEWSGIFHRNRTIPDVAILTKHQNKNEKFTCFIVSSTLLHRNQQVSWNQDHLEIRNSS
uniref:Endo/exonuclease/phosphatase domain-containing protein n=1 Tax=Heterorhabditis bacteriophora TaxID=37862 RepID=A0A1I7WJN7_HETBA